MIVLYLGFIEAFKNDEIATIPHNCVLVTDLFLYQLLDHALILGEVVDASCASLRAYLLESKTDLVLFSCLEERNFKHGEFTILVETER